MSLTPRLVVREATSDADLEVWREVRLAVLPDERAPSVEEMRAWARPETLHLLAEVDGIVAGSGLLDRSSFGHAFLQPRVLPDRRRRGIGSAVLRQLAERAVAVGFSEAGSHTEVDGAFAFAERFGFREVYRQIEQVRTIREESLPTIPVGITVVTAAERPDLWAKAYDPFAIGAIADMATHLP